MSHLLFLVIPQVGVASEMVYYFGDPQIGFSGDAVSDTRRFHVAANAAARDNASAVVIAGDLVNTWNNCSEIADYKSVWPTDFPSTTSVRMVPGNHDINSELKTVEDALEAISHYDTTFGVNYAVTKTRYSTMVMVDSELLLLPYLGLNGTNDTRILTPVEAQWNWLEKTLQAAASEVLERPHIFIVLHHPPFLNTENESHHYFNMPLVPRRRILRLARQYGVSHFLAGHTHTTRNVSTGDGNIHVLTTAGTARAFDGNGCGYRTLVMNSSSVEITYIRLPHECVPTLHPKFSAPEHSYMYSYFNDKMVHV